MTKRGTLTATVVFPPGGGGVTYLNISPEFKSDDATAGTILVTIGPRLPMPPGTVRGIWEPDDKPRRKRRARRRR